MFSFSGLFTHGIRPHLGAFVVVLFVAVLFVSAPFFLVYRAVRDNVPGAANILPAK